MELKRKSKVYLTKSELKPFKTPINMESITERLKKIIITSYQYGSIIEDEDWEKLNKQLDLRQKYLKTIFSSPFAKNEKKNIQDSIIEIQKIDKINNERIDFLKNATHNDIMDIKRKVTAVKKYSEIHEQS